MCIILQFVKNAFFAFILQECVHQLNWFRFEKLQFLLQQNPFPPETLGNLLLLYCRYQCFDLAADVLADYNHLTHKYLSPVSIDNAVQL